MLLLLMLLLLPVSHATGK